MLDIIVYTLLAISIFALILIIGLFTIGTIVEKAERPYLSWWKCFKRVIKEYF